MIGRILVVAAGAALAAAGTSNASNTTWTAVSAANADLSGIVEPTFAVDRDRVVAAWTARSGPNTSRIDAVSFTTTVARDAGSLAALASPTGDWTSLDHGPVLTAGPAGGHQIVWGGSRSLLSSDPFVGLAAAGLNADRSWGPAAIIGYQGTAVGPVDALTLPDGAVLTVNAATGAIRVQRQGAAPGPDLQAALGGGAAYHPAIGRDAAGGVWVAWYSAGTPNVTGVHLQQVDPVTGAGVGAAVRAPGSESVSNNDQRTVLACSAVAAGCRVGYATAEVGANPRIVTWAPGEAAARALVGGRASGASLNTMFWMRSRADGGYWAAWFDAGTRGLSQGFKVAVLAANGAAGPVIDAGDTSASGESRYTITGIPLSDRAVLLSAVTGATPRVFVNHVSLDDPSVPDTTGITEPRVVRRGPGTLVAPGRVNLRQARRSKCVKVRVQSSRPARVRVAIFSGRRSIRVFGAQTVVFSKPGKRVVCIRVPFRARTFDVRQPVRFAIAVREGATRRPREPRTVPTTTSNFTFF